MQRRDLLALSALATLSTAGHTQGHTPDRSQGRSVLTEVETELGSFIVAVDTARAPITVANYLALVDGRHLDGGTVYRIVTPANQTPETRHKIEVVQWGMNSSDSKPAPFAPIAHETTQQTGLKHLHGTVSMARLGPGTAAAEFFICIGAQPALDFGGGRNPDGQGFAAFGQVTAGLEVVQALYGRGQATSQYLQPGLAVRSVRRLAPGGVMPLITR